MSDLGEFLGTKELLIWIRRPIRWESPSWAPRRNFGL